MPKPDLIPEMSSQEENDEERNWRSVVISGLERKIDLKVIEPYKKVKLLSIHSLLHIQCAHVCANVAQLHGAI